MASFNFTCRPKGTISNTVHTGGKGFKLRILGDISQSTSPHVKEPVSGGAGVYILASCHVLRSTQCCLCLVIVPHLIHRIWPGDRTHYMKQRERRPEKGWKGKGKPECRKASIKSREMDPSQSRKRSSHPNLPFLGGHPLPTPRCCLCWDSRKDPSLSPSKEGLQDQCLLPYKKSLAGQNPVTWFWQNYQIIYKSIFSSHFCNQKNFKDPLVALYSS